MGGWWLMMVMLVKLDAWKGYRLENLKIEDVA